MTQLGELVAVGMIAANGGDGECPFHEKKHTCDGVENDLEGNAAALGTNLDAGTVAGSTVVRSTAPDKSFRAPRKEADPDELPYAQRTVQLFAGKESCKYPVGFQAHHLIPAKESLARSTTLLKYIEKKKGKLCCDLGYNVNGSENGAWLPGKHPVDGNGLNLWGSASKALPDKEDVGRKKVVRRRDDGVTWSYTPLAGPRAGNPGANAETNLKWQYVMASMEFLGARQFHDRHPTYSKNVKDELETVGKLLEHFSGTRKKPAACPKCRDEAKKKLIPPLKVLSVLNRLSQRYYQYVVGKMEHKQFYTSSWCDPARRTQAVLKKAKSRRGRG